MDTRYLNGHTQWVSRQYHTVIWYDIATNTWNIGKVESYFVEGILKSFNSKPSIKSTTKCYYEIPEFFDPGFPWIEKKEREGPRKSKTKSIYWEKVTPSFKKIGPNVEFIHVVEEVAKEAEFVILGDQESPLI